MSTPPSPLLWLSAWPLLWALTFKNRVQVLCVRHRTCIWDSRNVSHTWNLSTWEAWARWSWVPGQPMLKPVNPKTDLDINGELSSILKVNALPSKASNTSQQNPQLAEDSPAFYSKVSPIPEPIPILTVIVKLSVVILFFSLLRMPCNTKLEQNIISNSNTQKIVQVS